MLQAVSELKTAFRPDLVHINLSSSEPGLFFQLHTSSTHQAPTLVTVHSSHTFCIERNSLLVRTLNSARWVTTVSQAMLADIHRLAPQTASYSSVVYNGLAMPPDKPTPLSFEAPRLVCLGRMVTEKGFDIALDAFAAILARFPKARLILAGDGPEKPHLEQQAADLGVGEYVEFVGWIDPRDVPGLINDSTLIVVPSRWREPFGLVAVQAGQMARPVVAARVGGLPEVVVHHQTGLLFEKENSNELAELAIYLLHNPKTAVQMGLAARKRARSEFSLERFANAYDAVYHQLCSIA
jgi:glycogen(starch) synthase